MHEGEPIFKITPFFEKELHPPETPDEMKASAKLPEPSKLTPPTKPVTPPTPLIKSYPVGSPQEKTNGIEGMVSKCLQSL